MGANPNPNQIYTLKAVLSCGQRCAVMWQNTYILIQNGFWVCHHRRGWLGLHEVFEAAGPLQRQLFERRHAQRDTRRERERGGVLDIEILGSQCIW